MRIMRLTYTVINHKCQGQNTNPLILSHIRCLVGRHLPRLFAAATLTDHGIQRELRLRGRRW